MRPRPPSPDVGPSNGPRSTRRAAGATPLPALLPALLALACAGGAGRGQAAPAAAPSPAASLEAEVRELVAGFRGHIGVYARHLETGEEVAVAADALYPTASMVKVPLLVGLEAAVAKGRLALDERVVYHDSLHYPSEGDLANKLREGAAVSLESLAFLMIGLSDNTASLWIQGLVGGGTVNDWLAGHGFEHTRVNSRVEGRRDDWEVYGWGQSTPREMARLLVMIRDGGVVSAEASDRMYRLLSRSWWPHGATSVIPAVINVAAKPGAVSAARSEALVVNAPGGDYVLAIMTREQEDTRWTLDNEGDRLIREISAAAFRYWGG